ncbi:MAG TPA: hypothetical protein VIM62_13705, partial [Acidobacteriaceae bacterium]
HGFAMMMVMAVMAVALHLEVSLCKLLTLCQTRSCKLCCGLLIPPHRILHAHATLPGTRSGHHYGLKRHRVFAASGENRHQPRQFGEVITATWRHRDMGAENHSFPPLQNKVGSAAAGHHPGQAVHANS